MFLSNFDLAYKVFFTFKNRGSATYIVRKADDSHTRLRLAERTFWRTAASRGNGEVERALGRSRLRDAAHFLIGLLVYWLIG